MIKDEAGVELLYIPIGGIQAGQNSQTLKFQIDCGPGSVLTCTPNPAVSIFARRVGVGTVYVNIADTPLDLSVLGPGYVMFEFYAHAEVDLVESERIPISVGHVSQSGVQWVS